MSIMGKVYEIRRRNILETIIDALTAKGIQSRLGQGARNAYIQSSWDALEVKFLTHRQLLGATLFCFYEARLLLQCDDIEGSEPWEIRLGTEKGFWNSSPFFRGRCQHSKKLSEQQVLLLKILNENNELINLIKVSGIKSLLISILPKDNWLKINLTLYPVAGMISVIYFPPVPPHSVSLIRQEIESHYRIIEILSDLLKFYLCKKNLILR